MSSVRSGHMLFGVGLVVMGYALLVIAFAKQAQRPAEVAAGSSAAETRPSPAAEPTPFQRDALPAPPSPATTAAASGAPVSPGTFGGAEFPADVADARTFVFSAGGAVMARDEVQRLMAFGKAVARRPSIKVSVEAFSDRPGSEPVMIGIAKHRAKVTQMLLAKAGVSEDRVTATVADMGSDVRLARSIRVTATPGLSETERP
jgi:outer membrane protein OmpA-like peptidoglycan-associated protein